MKKIYQNMFISGLLFLVMGGCFQAMAEDVQIHGFISQGYLKTDQNNYLADTDDGTFQFNEMGINFTTYATRRLKIGCQFFARDIGNVGNDEIVVNWAFGEYNFRNWLGLRAGLIKLPFGFYNDTRDYDALRTAIFLPGSVYNEYLRDGSKSIKGIELFGSQAMGVLGMLKYQFSTGNTQIPVDSGTAELLQIRFPDLHLTDIEVGPVYDVHLEWLAPLDGLRLGVSYVKTDFLYNAEDDSATSSIRYRASSSQWYTISAEFIWNNLTLSAENYVTINDVAVRLYNKGKFILAYDADTETSFDDCYYLRLSYRFTDWLETGFYYSEFLEDPDVNKDYNELKDQCLSFRFDINPFWLFKLEAHLMNGNSGVKEDNDGHTYNEWMLYAAKMSFMF
ncbi:MAG: hypothetical protein KJ737_20740 [Proteobacteria bacterium]|nr:hypothetical protein [Pseudomonadota bacterium]